MTLLLVNINIILFSSLFFSNNNNNKKKLHKNLKHLFFIYTFKMKYKLKDKSSKSSLFSGLFGRNTDTVKINNDVKLISKKPRLNEVFNINHDRPIYTKKISNAESGNKFFKL